MAGADGRRADPVLHPPRPSGAPRPRGSDRRRAAHRVAAARDGALPREPVLPMRPTPPSSIAPWPGGGRPAVNQSSRPPTARSACRRAASCPAGRIWTAPCPSPATAASSGTARCPLRSTSPAPAGSRRAACAIDVEPGQRARRNRQHRFVFHHGLVLSSASRAAGSPGSPVASADRPSTPAFPYAGGSPSTCTAGGCSTASPEILRRRGPPARSGRSLLAWDGVEDDRARRSASRRRRSGCAGTWRPWLVDRCLDRLGAGAADPSPVRRLIRDDTLFGDLRPDLRMLDVVDPAPRRRPPEPGRGSTRRACALADPDLLAPTSRLDVASCTARAAHACCSAEARSRRSPLWQRRHRRLASHDATFNSVMAAASA